MASFARILEWIFVLYFIFHIPLTLFLDLQAVLPASLFPQAALDLMKWYTVTYKDPLMMETPPWILTLIYFEALLQLPFFFVAVYAFYKGGCKWIRIPAIIYSTQVVTVVLLIIMEFLYSDFPTFKLGTLSNQERLVLVSIYSPFLVIPLLLLLTMVYSPQYRCTPQKKQKSK